ncbi:uncharacterized protein EV420DRAFT_1639099 [Desarmillaria tabescens]|uniref:Fungal-type protein kinase domain-containing protein n=1 Tax=Armillaria tabescens TaxID=1929756 RepID=A0AA39NCE2_ARMTA|nr:uncharacterized protein EV420DRAFT_1639099 [Desarmillaria tabescens]KAK0463011.1 hypothetical protein EV420DRAFT_1639099 [Desarmillaria tabescens]
MFDNSRNLINNRNSNGTVYWQEFKPREHYIKGTDSLTSDGNGKDPQGNEQENTTEHRDTDGIVSPFKSTTSKKRYRSEDDTSRLRSKNSVALSTREGVATGNEAMNEENESKARRAMRFQCGRYFLEMLPSDGLRTHCTGALVAIGRVQTPDYDPCLCKPAATFEGDAESKQSSVTDALSTMLVGLGQFTFNQRRMQEEFCDDKALTDDPRIYLDDRYGHPKDKKSSDRTAILVGLKLKLQDDIKVEVTLGRIISRAPGIIGRNTCVIEATSEHEGWKGKELIVKISWPTIDRESEAYLVQKARNKARTMTHGKKPDWALDHLPDILLSQDFDYDADSTQVKFMAFFENALLVRERKVEYEKRVCRVMVQEKLYPLEELKTVKGPGNIMWRRNAKGDLCGVLNDFDLSTLRDTTGPSSLQRTGTLPYMAYELLINDENGNPPQHLYRHDVESIFYVILLLCVRYEVVITQESSTPAIVERRKVRSQFDAWYNDSHDTLMDKKNAFFTPRSSFSPLVNSGFADFQPWADQIHKRFIVGFSALNHYMIFQPCERATGPFDEETLQDWVSYSVIAEICSQFAGSALVVHNDQLEEVANNA